MITTIAKATDGFPDDQNRDLNYNYMHTRGHEGKWFLSLTTQKQMILIRV